MFVAAARSQMGQQQQERKEKALPGALAWQGSWTSWVGCVLLPQAPVAVPAGQGRLLGLGALGQLQHEYCDLRYVYLSGIIPGSAAVSNRSRAGTSRACKSPCTLAGLFRSLARAARLPELPDVRIRLFVRLVNSPAGLSLAGDHAQARGGAQRDRRVEEDLLARHEV
jgi:hypothetical protein